MMHNTTQEESKKALITKANILISQYNTQQENNDPSQSPAYQKITKKPSIPPISASERVRLIQIGNKFLNEKNINKAKKIFTAIGYNEGLERIARYYADKGNLIGAYLMFRQAEAKEKTLLEQKIVTAIKALLATPNP